MKKNRTYDFFVFIAALLFASACSGKRIASPDIVISGDAAEISEAESAVMNEIYTLTPGDLIIANMYLETDMHRETRIASDGSVSFPLIGNIKIADLTLAQAEAKIEEVAKKYFKFPHVTLLIKEYGNKNVFVMGQVRNPNAIVIPPETPLTLLEAITQTGGFNDVAATSKVRVIRNRKGRKEVIHIDASQITKYGNSDMNIQLQPGDIVFVPMSIF
ncbi:MAG: polysaccharide export protein [Elusimicrobiales bacterium]|nr:polysaccharide export protein [Elusimicrobiales bacterium]